MIRRHWDVIMSQVASYCSVSLDGAKCSGFTSARYFIFIIIPITSAPEFRFPVSIVHAARAARTRYVLSKHARMMGMQSFRGLSLEGEIKLSLYPLFLHVGHSLDDPGEHSGHQALVNVWLLTREFLEQLPGRYRFP